jgi:hypothetical protein
MTGDTFAGTSAKGRNEQLTQSLPEAKSRAYLMEVNGTDTPKQRASKTGKPIVEKGLEKMDSIQQRRCGNLPHERQSTGVGIQETAS